MKNKTWTILAAIFVLLISTTLVMAGETPNDGSLEVPATGGYVSGTAYTMRAVINGSAYLLEDNASQGLANVTNVTFEASPDGTTWYTLGVNSSNVNNFTLSNWTLNFNSWNYGDNTTWQFRAKATNDSATLLTTTAITGVIIDNTLPVITSTYTTGTTFGSPISITVDNATSCRVRFGTVSNDYAMTLSGRTCSYALVGGSPPDGSYETSFIVSDGTNTTLNVVRGGVIDVYSNTGASNAVSATIAKEVSKSEASKSQLKWGGLIILILGAFYLMNNGNKKTRRK